MQISKAKQGSEEWAIARRGKATASNFSKIVTSKGELSKTLKEYAMNLAAESLVDEVEDFYMSEDMQRGVDLEPEARQAYQEYTFNHVEEVGFMDCGNYGYSADGICGEDGIIEIKCPKWNNHGKYIFEDKSPSKYLQQIQGGLMVSGRKWCDFVSYHPNFPEHELFIKRVYRDEEFIEKLKIGIDKVVELRDQYLNKIK